jgi:hypothetical protein
MSFPASMEMLAGDIIASWIALVQSLEFRLKVFCGIRRYQNIQSFGKRSNDLLPVLIAFKLFPVRRWVVIYT